MNIRDNIILDVPFNELEPGQDQIAFIKALLRCNEMTRVLQGQYGFDPQSINNIMSCLNNLEYISVEVILLTEIIQNMLFLIEQQSFTSSNPKPQSHSAAEKSGCKIDMPEGMSDKIIDLFSDFMNAEIITDPWITPQGTTYQLGQIKKWIKANPSDPIGRAALIDQDLIKNNLFTSIKNLFINENKYVLKQLDLDALQKLLTCPISGELFNDPVMAEDGVTYDRIFLQAYLEKNKNKTPQSVIQSKPLYPNRFITDLFEQTPIKNLIDEHVFADNKTLKEKNKHLIQPLSQYIQERGKQENYTGTTSGFCKLDKILAPTHAIQVLNGKISPHTFFSRHKNDLEVLQQGKLKDKAKPAIDEINNMRNGI